MIELDALLKQLEMQMREPPRPPTYAEHDAVQTNSYKTALFAVLCERKQAIEMDVKGFECASHCPEKLDQVLKDFLYEADPPTPDPDDEPEDVDRYRSIRDHVRRTYNAFSTELQGEHERLRLHMQNVLLDQKHREVRPITIEDMNRAGRSVDYRICRAEVDAKQTVCNALMNLDTRHQDARRKRRNFSKEAIATLQDFFEKASYPNEEQKRELAEQCNISTQQVSNWFGNKRVRSRGKLDGSDVGVAHPLPHPTHQPLMPDHHFAYNEYYQVPMQGFDQPQPQPFVDDPNQISTLYGATMASMADM